MFKNAIERIRRSRGGRAPAAAALEPLEGRALLSASFFGGFGGPGGGRGFAPVRHLPGGSAVAVTLGQLSTSIQNGIAALATTDGVTGPATTAVVSLGNRDGVETYSVRVSGTGTSTVLTVDQNGNPVTSPTHSSTTLGTLANTAVTSELTAIASALGLTAPTDATTLAVTTTNGASIYTANLASTTSTGRRTHYTTISVDASGNPTGNEQVPLSTLSAAIQSGLTSNAPSGATALTATSLVTVRTENGVTTYSATYKSTGVRTTVTVNSSGALTDLPSASTVTFSTIPSAAQSAIQTLATAAGSTTTIAGTQNVTAYDEGNGTVIYSARVTVTKTDSNGNTYTYPVTITVDAAGNPTVLPGGGFGSLPGGRGGFCV